ncbi:hypothetical protein ACX9MO_13915 [Pseudooceanicola sp. 502str34]|uniref:hypothetical protein n=1 Tax=Maritimibacter alkaliphilus TaxID=404236 RepID=UPI001C95F74A|nr:hypothetical protein [Maritimibacter alkaliphilus]MBY6089046.1 hypothetical protein [Maritimibacter alkaliphilus]
MKTRAFSGFLHRDDGAVTVDWVVLCAMAIALVVVAIQGMTAATTGVTDDLVSTMTDWTF